MDPLLDVETPLSPLVNHHGSGELPFGDESVPIIVGLANWMSQRQDAPYLATSFKSIGLIASRLPVEAGIH